MAGPAVTHDVFEHVVVPLLWPFKDERQFWRIDEGEAAEQFSSGAYIEQPYCAQAAACSYLRATHAQSTLICCAYGDGFAQ